MNQSLEYLRYGFTFLKENVKSNIFGRNIARRPGGPFVGSSHTEEGGERKLTDAQHPYQENPV